MISAFILLFAIKTIRYIAIVIAAIHNYVRNIFLLLEKRML
jgi:hypothetical protein